MTETLAERLKGLVETIEFSVSPDAEIAARFAREALAWCEARLPSAEGLGPFMGGDSLDARLARARTLLALLRKRMRP